MVKILSVLLLLLYSCSSTQNTATVPAGAKEVRIEPSANPAQGDQVNIKFAEQNGDYLVLDVSYSGGCAEHEFDLVSKGNYSATYPPEIEVTLVHNANGDRCRSYIDQKLYFDLRPVQYDGTNRVLLVFTNTNKTLQYNY